MTSKGRIPSYRLHKATGQAVVTLSGHDHYLGRHNTEASRRAYDTLVARWASGGRRALQGQEGATVDEVAVAYWTWARTYYVKDGRPTGQLPAIKSAIATLSRLFGETPAAEFTPSRLKAVRQVWVDDGSSREYANRRAWILKHAFTWAVEHEMVPGGVAMALRAVSGLSRGRTTAHELPPVLPVPQDHIDAVWPFLERHVLALVKLQLATGMRPGEACIIRPCDVDRSGETWTYRPSSHKTEHRDRDRVVQIGPRARAVMDPLIAAAETPTSYLFPARGRGEPGRPYNETSYYRAIHKACDRAGIERWAVGRLRHNFATAVRAGQGIEAASILLGHSDVRVTTVYAERDIEKARKVIEEIG
jgi:integrase